MSLKIDRLIRQRKTEIVVTIVLFIFAISLVLLSSGSWQGNSLIQIGEKLGFSLLVALIVRWLTVLFSESETSVNSDKAEYYEAIKSARQRIWIYQTWLTGVETDGAEIVSSKAHDIRLLLLSFEKSSPIHARLKGRRMKVQTAKHYSASSVKPFIENRLTDCIKFNYAHHPGWIAIIDSFIFWGATPIDRDSHSVEFLFHKHPVASPEGSFWLNQFKLLWNEYSHNLEEEKNYNEELLDLMVELNPATNPCIQN
jgi:hypothetical protein